MLFLAGLNHPVIDSCLLRSQCVLDWTVTNLRILSGTLSDPLAGAAGAEEYPAGASNASDLWRLALVILLVVIPHTCDTPGGDTTHL